QFVGRVRGLAPLAPMDEEALVNILTEPRNALTRQFRKLFDMEGAELDFTPGALKLIAKMARERDTGARGLRSIVEEVMTDIMFELPELETKEKFTITDKIIRREQPMYEPNKTADKKSA